MKQLTKFEGFNVKRMSFKEFIAYALSQPKGTTIDFACSAEWCEEEQRYIEVTGWYGYTTFDTVFDFPMAMVAYYGGETYACAPLAMQSKAVDEYTENEEEDVGKMLFDFLTYNNYDFHDEVFVEVVEDGPEAIQTSCGLIHIEKLDNLEESDRMKIYDSSKAYMDYWGMETILEYAEEAGVTPSEWREMLVEGLERTGDIRILLDTLCINHKKIYTAFAGEEEVNLDFTNKIGGFYIEIRD